MAVADSTLQGAGLGTAVAPGIGTAVGAGVGLLKGLLIDQPAAQRQREVEATKALTSPFTGLNPDTRQLQFGSKGVEGALQGGLAGLDLGLQQQQLERQNQILQSVLGAGNQGDVQLVGRRQPNQPAPTSPFVSPEAHSALSSKLLR